MAISPQIERLNRETAERRHLSFDILWDRGNEVAARYGLRFRLPDDLIAVYGKAGIDLPTANGDGSWTLPMPARFVIDRAGVIRAADADPDYTRRPEPAATVRILQRLAGS